MAASDEGDEAWLRTRFYYAVVPLRKLDEQWLPLVRGVVEFESARLGIDPPPDINWIAPITYEQLLRLCTWADWLATDSAVWGLVTRWPRLRICINVELLQPWSAIYPDGHREPVDRTPDLVDTLAHELWHFATAAHGAPNTEADAGAYGRHRREAYAPLLPRLHDAY